MTVTIDRVLRGFDSVLLATTLGRNGSDDSQSILGMIFEQQSCGQKSLW